MFKQTFACVVFYIAIINVYSLTIYMKDLEGASSEIVQNYKEGDGKSFVQSQRSANGERGDRGYSSTNQEASGQKGHHDKEDEKKQYAEADGFKKSHNRDDGYYDENQKSAKGQQGYHYVDSGSYAKGHDTKGRHNVHKLNEFKKKTDFFDEDHDKAHKENHGSFEANKEIASGSAEKGEQAKKVYKEGEFEKSGKFEKGLFSANDAGHKGAHGRDAFYNNDSKVAGRINKSLFKEIKFSDQEH